VSGCRVQGRRSRSRATARRAALDVVAASRTIESEEDASSCLPLMAVGQGCYRFGRGAAGAALILSKAEFGKRIRLRGWAGATPERWRAGGWCRQWSSSSRVRGRPS